MHHASNDKQVPPSECMSGIFESSVGLPDRMASVSTRQAYRHEGLMNNSENVKQHRSRISHADMLGKVQT